MLHMDAPPWKTLASYFAHMSCRPFALLLGSHCREHPQSSGVVQDHGWEGAPKFWWIRFKTEAILGLTLPLKEMAAAPKLSGSQSSSSKAWSCSSLASSACARSVGNWTKTLLGQRQAWSAALTTALANAVG